jgi:signal peptide peptidase SppA
MKTTLFDESGLAAIYPGAWARVQAAMRTDAVSAEMMARARAAGASPVQPPNGIAVVPVHGVITKGESVLSMLFGGASLDSLQANLIALRDDNTVRAIVLHIDSPGGGVYGVDETAELIADVNKRKRVVAYTDGMCASAAYWLASATSRIVHFDYSKQMEAEGVVPTLVKAGEHKAEANPYQPLSDEDRAAMQSRINAYYALFASRVARGRGVSVDQVRGEAFGDGRVVGAKQAVSSGMADEVGTFADVLRGMTRDTSSRAAQAAESLLALRLRAASVAC